MLCVSSTGKVFDATDRLARPIKSPRHLNDETKCHFSPFDLIESIIIMSILRNEGVLAISMCI